MPIKKIVFSGPESTGKTTLSKELSEMLDAPWVSEYARYHLHKNVFQGEKTLKLICAGQLNWEKFYETRAKDFLVCDTDPLVLAVWALDKLGYIPNFLEEAVANHPYALRFLCYPDTKWLPDPLREDGNRREVIFEMYLSLIEKFNLDFILLKGNFDKKREIVDLEIKKFYF
jgi:nicotinamide riboside kinase